MRCRPSLKRTVSVGDMWIAKGFLLEARSILKRGGGLASLSVPALSFACVENEGAVSSLP